MTKANKLTIILLLILTMILWGVAWTSAKFIAKITTHEVLVFWRFLPSFLCFAFIVIIFKFNLCIDLKSFFLVLLTGIIMAVYNSFFFLGLKKGFAGAGGIIIASFSPLFTFLMSRLSQKKEIQILEKIGLLLGLFGGILFLEVWHISFHTLLLNGNFFFIIAAFLWAAVTILSKKSQEKVNIFVFSFYAYGFAALIYFFIAIPNGLFSNFNLYSSSLFWLNILYLSLLSNALATSIYFFCTTKISPERVSSFMFLIPLTAVSSAFFILKEIMPISAFLGAGFSMLAVYIINKK